MDIWHGLLQTPPEVCPESCAQLQNNACNTDLASIVRFKVQEKGVFDGRSSDFQIKLETASR